MEKPKEKEVLYGHKGVIPLNIVQADRISFSVLRNQENVIIKIENISYEINFKDRWEWVVRYDDHGGTGSLHAHIRISLDNERDIESSEGIKKYKNKNYQLTWVCKNINKNYLLLRKRILKNMGLDLY